MLIRNYATLGGYEQVKCAFCKVYGGGGIVMVEDCLHNAATMSGFILGVHFFCGVCATPLPASGDFIPRTPEYKR